MNVKVVLSPYCETELPELEDEVGGKMSGGVAVVKASVSFVVIMGAEPLCCIAATKEIRPSDFLLVFVGLLNHS